MSGFKARDGVTLIETLVAVAITLIILSASVLSLRQMEWGARRNHEYLVADSLAWDVIWKAYNSPRWSSAIAGTNSALRTGLLVRDDKDVTVRLVTSPDGSLETLVKWRDLRPLNIDGEKLPDDADDADQYRYRRLVMTRPRTFDRFWRRVEIDHQPKDK